MKRRIEDIIIGLLRPINPFVITILGALTLCWGLWVICPFWDVFTSAPVYSRALSFAPEWAWGLWATTCGMILLFSVYKGAYKTLSLALGFAMWHWFTIAGMLWWGDWRNTAGITYTFIGIYSIYSYFNTKISYTEKTHF